MVRRLSAFWIACLLVAMATRVVGQEASPRQKETLGRIIAVGVALSSAEFIGGGSFDVDESGLHEPGSAGSSMRIRHVPWRHWFGERSKRFRPWVLGALGRVDIRQPIELLGDVPDASKFVADSLAAIGGVEIDLGDGGWYLDPTAGLIYSQIESELRYNSPESEALKDLLDGVLFNWEADALTWTAGLRLGYRIDWANGIALDVAGEAVGLWTNPISTDSPVQDTSTASNYSRLRARLRIPLGVEALGGDLVLVPRVAHTFFSEEIEEPLESDSMTDLNLRLMVELGDAPAGAGWWRRHGTQAVGLSVSRTVADSFEGWSFGVTLHSWTSGW